MNRAAIRICALTILFLVGSDTGQQAYGDTQSGHFPRWRIERDIRRFRIVATDNVLNVLAIRPGMTILDIGAGTGQFAYEFARRMNGTGKVYATDSNGECIEYMEKEAHRRGLGNLRPVLVKKDGIDAFYGKHKYDLITVFHVSMAYGDRVDYFRELRRALTEDGRLILILYKSPTPFSPGDFTGDFRGLITELSREPAGTPFYRILKDSTRKTIRDHPGAEPPEELKTVLAEDFNAFLSDTRFAAQFYEGSVFREEVSFFPEERAYADWFLLPYRDSDVRNREIGIRSASGGRTFEPINKLLIVQRYRKFLKKDGLFTSGFTPQVKAAFEKAGYRIDREYSGLIPMEDMIVFSALQASGLRRSRHHDHGIKVR